MLHPGRMHAYVDRHYRDRESRENISIIIPVIICSIAQEQGKQYTKRLLPEFLAARSVIRLDHLLEAAGLAREERTTERTCEILGCIDSRTARRRLCDLNDAITAVVVELGCRRASTPELGAMPGSTPDTSPLDQLHLLYHSEQSAQQRAGRDAAPLPSLEAFLQAALGKQRQKIPSSCVSLRGCPP